MENCNLKWKQNIQKEIQLQLEIYGEYLRMQESYKRFVKTWIRFANPWIRTVS